MALPAVNQYVRTETAYYNTIAEENIPPAESTRRFGLRTVVNWTKNGAPVSAQAAALAAQSAFLTLAFPTVVETIELEGEPRGYFNCRKVDSAVFLVANVAIAPNSN